MARPLPAGTPKVDNTLSAQMYKHQMAIRNAIVQIDNKFKNIQNQINQYVNAPNAIIGQAQTIVDVGANMASSIAPLAGNITNSVSAMQSLLSGSFALNAVNPVMHTLLSDLTSTTGALTTSLGALVGLPPVTNPTIAAITMELYNNAYQAN